MGNFSSKPPFDLAAFLAVKASPQAIAAARQRKRHKFHTDNPDQPATESEGAAPTDKPKSGKVVSLRRANILPFR